MSRGRFVDDIALPVGATVVVVLVLAWVGLVGGEHGWLLVGPCVGRWVPGG